MSANKFTTMAQLREALQQGGHVTKRSYSRSATYYPAGFRGWSDRKPGDPWPVDVSLVAYNALLNRGELRRLETSNSYRSSDWTLKSMGCALVEAEAKVNAAKSKLEAAQRVADEAIAAYKAAQAALDAAEAELSKLVNNKEEVAS